MTGIQIRVVSGPEWISHCDHTPLYIEFIKFVSLCSNEINHCMRQLARLALTAILGDLTFPPNSRLHQDPLILENLSCENHILSEMVLKG